MAGYFTHKTALVESDSVGDGTRVWAFAHIMEGARLGRDCNVGDHCFIESGAVIGNNVTVKNGVSVWEKIEIEDDVFLGPNMVFTNDLLPRSGVRDRGKFLPVLVKTGATIGANATIICGVTVGEYSLVGAGSVVTKDVPAFAVCYGNPARPAGYVCKCAKKLKFAKNRARCVCGSEYSRKKDVVGLMGRKP